MAKFEVANAEGKMIYYNIIDGTTNVEVMYGMRCRPGYSGIVNIPSTVTYKGITYTVKRIGKEAFRHCTGLTFVIVPNTVTSIGEEAFEHCNSLISVVIPFSVISIGEEAFGHCYSLTSIDVDTENPNYSSIDGVLYNKSQDTLLRYPAGKQGDFIIPNSVRNIGDGAFSHSEGLTSIVIPGSVKSIGEEAFWVCTALTSIDIPNSVTMIGNGAFWVCSSLVSVTIPASVVIIGDGVFRYCKDLTSINVDEKNPKYSSIDGVWYNKPQTTLLCYPTAKQGDFIIPNSVKTIGKEAFRGCSGLTSIKVDAENTNYSSVDGVLYNKSQETLLLCPAGKQGRFTIPNSVKSIGGYAFYQCRDLTSINIPNSVTSIGNSAFSGCTGLTSVAIGNSVKSIESGAFNGCEALTSLIIPNSVRSIGYCAFKDCKGMLSIIIGDSVESIEMRAFEDCKALSFVVIGNSVKNIGDIAFSFCMRLDTVICLSSVPAHLSSNVFVTTTNKKRLIVPCGSENAYKSSSWGEYFSNITTQNQ